ncbi:MAG: glycosyltransferase family 9 protein [Parachlamydiales bacterium]|nr:glycosyltransferase family 9 protein [Parachlamydiales bacterium]
MDSPFPSRILIVKTSSLGDIVQSFIVLNDLKRRFPNVQIDWAVEASFAPIVAAHPMISKTIPLDIKGKKNLLNGLKTLRKEKYDVVFDLQSNCKSGVVTLLARGKVKVGYGIKSVREWPNVLATHVRFEVSKQQNIRLFYLELIERYFQNPISREMEGVRFRMEGKIDDVLPPLPPGLTIMVCPGSKWVNKQLKESTWVELLQKIEAFCSCSFLLIWGDEAEKKLCKELSAQLKNGVVVEKLPLPTWQNLMNEVDLVIAVDSGALHLCATTHTPSFSIFGPTSPDIFKPIGPQHVAVQGPCPYGRKFEKQCPVLRSCPTGACMKELSAESLFQAFQSQCAFLRL